MVPPFQEDPTIMSDMYLAPWCWKMAMFFLEGMDSLEA